MRLRNAVGQAETGAERCGPTDRPAAWLHRGRCSRYVSDLMMTLDGIVPDRVIEPVARITA